MIRVAHVSTIFMSRLQVRLLYLYYRVTHVSTIFMSRLQARLLYLYLQTLPIFPHGALLEPTHLATNF